MIRGSVAKGTDASRSDIDRLVLAKALTLEVLYSATMARPELDNLGRFGQLESELPDETETPRLSSLRKQAREGR